jgi:hypothetical protein
MSAEALKGWYSVRCVFHMLGEGGSEEGAPYEERVTLWRAAGFEEAIELAEQEAAEYVDILGVAYLGLAQCYYLGAEIDDILSGTEVFSLIRSSDLPPEEYLDAFFDTGDEYQRHAPNDAT